MRCSFALLLVTAASAWAQEPEYWPLTPGNQWIYRASPGEPLTVSVERYETAGGRIYSVLTGLGGATLIRQDGARLLAYDGATRTEKVYLDFGAAIDRPQPSAAHPCNATAAIASRSASAKLPLGDFEGLTQVRYGGNMCADAGLTEDLFLPYVGLMRRTETSFTGPRSYDLVYARINGYIMVSTPETGFAVHVARLANAADARGWQVRMTLRHTSQEPLRLDFSSGQTFDVSVVDEKDVPVYRWSADKSFIAALQSIEVTGERNWSALIPAIRAPGRYTVEAWLTTSGGQPFKASASIVVR